MPVTNYYTVNGVVIGESTGTETTSYVRDALGSITATVDQQGKVRNTYRYKPYGSLLSKTGTAPDPRFMWTGDTGSRTTKAPGAEQYNRIRHCGTTQAQWTTRDPVWPEQLPFAYGNSSPTTLIDPSGLFAFWINSFISRDMSPQYSLNICGVGPRNNWILATWNPWVSYVQGDNRTFFQRGTSRLKSYFKVEECAIGNLAKPDLGFHVAQGYSLSTTHQIFAKCYDVSALKGKPNHSITILSQSRSKYFGLSEILMQFSGKDPFIPLAPSIEFTAYFIFVVDYCTGFASFSMRSYHTAFPWFEGKVRLPSGVTTPIFEFTPPWQNFVALYQHSITDAEGYTFLPKPCKECCNR